MKKIFLVFVLLAAGFLLGQTKFNVHGSFVHIGSNEIVVFDDKDTGTRCYAITNAQYHVAGYAMQCFPKTAIETKGGR
jgi:hypothetical protein